MTTHIDAILTLGRSSMLLNVHSNTLYLYKPKAKSRTGDQFSLSDNARGPQDNGAVLNITTSLKNVMPSAAKAETWGPVFELKIGWSSKNYLDSDGPPSTFDTNLNRKYDCLDLWARS